MIKQEYTIKAPIEKVWEALVEPKLIEKWSGAPAEMSDKKNAEFKLWRGGIWGKNTWVDAPKHLEQDWFGGKWENPSKLCIAMTEEGGKTHVTLMHCDVPEKEERDFADGWKNYYFGPLIQLVEGAI